MAKWSHNSLVIAKVKDSNPREIYAGLVWWQRNKGFKPGWVAMKFKEIFGKWPKPLIPVDPQPPSNELREYLGIMKNRWKQKKKREEAKKLLDDLHEDGCACWQCVEKLRASASLVSASSSRQEA